MGTIFRTNLVAIYMFKVKNRNRRTRCEICSKLICSSVSIANFEQVNDSWKGTFKDSTADIYLLKINNGNTKTMYEICPWLTLKTPEWRHCRRSGVFIATFEQISHIVLVFRLLTINKWMPAGSEAKIKSKHYCNDYLIKEPIFWKNYELPTESIFPVISKNPDSI